MAVTIRGKTLPLPILQGGMGVGISLDGLSGSVVVCGGMGTLSTAVCGFAEPDFAQHPFEANLPRWPPKFPTVTPPLPPSSAAVGRRGCCASCGTGTMAASPTF